MSFKLLRKRHKLHFSSHRRLPLSVNGILTSVVQTIVILLYMCKFYNLFYPRIHRSIKNYLSILEEQREPHGAYVDFNEQIKSVELVYSVSIPIEYLKIVNKNLSRLLNVYPFYTEHGWKGSSKNSIRDTLQKLLKLDNFTTFHDSYLCEFDFSSLKKDNCDEYIDGVSIFFLKLYESSIVLQFSIRPNSSFYNLFNTICNSPEWRSSVPVWNDWLSILKGYNPILHVSNEDRIRRNSYLELMEHLRATMEEIIYNPLLKGIHTNLKSEGNKAVVYTTQKIHEINRESSIFKTIHSASGRVQDIDQCKYFEMAFENLDVFFVPDEEAGAASLTIGDIRSSIYELSILQNYRWMYYSIRRNHHALNEIIYQLLEKKWYQFSKLFLYRKVAKIKLKILFYKNMYIRAMHDDELERVDAILAATESQQKLFERVIQNQKKEACSKVDKLLKSLDEIGEDTNVLTTSYLSNVIQYLGILLGVLALLSIGDIISSIGVFFTHILSFFTKYSMSQLW